jgi:hypothetical protein
MKKGEKANQSINNLERLAMNKEDMVIEEGKELLKPGYLPVETGYYHLPNGNILMRTLTRMPRCKGEMVDWFFGYMDSEIYRLWEPDHHESFEWVDGWRPGHYIGASHVTREYIGAELKEVKATFIDPVKFFDTSKFEEANVGAVIISQFHFNDVPVGYTVFFVRDTDFGCELRHRAWMPKNTIEEAAMEMLTHSISGMGNLADFLPDLYAKRNPDK